MLLALQQTQAGRDELGEVPKLPSRDSVFGEALKLGGKGHSIHCVNIGLGGIAGKEMAKSFPRSVHIPRSKTDQAEEGVDVALLRTHGADTRPVAALEACRRMDRTPG